MKNKSWLLTMLFLFLLGGCQNNSIQDEKNVPNPTQIEKESSGNEFTREDKLYNENEKKGANEISGNEVINQIFDIDAKDVWTVIEEACWENGFTYDVVFNGKDYGARIVMFEGDLQEIEIPSRVYNQQYPVVAIGEYSFDNTNITSVVIPETVIEIGEGAFENCTKLSNLEIPETVKYMGANAFKNTTWLDFKKFTQELIIVNGIVIDGTELNGSVSLPEGVVGIASKAFAGSLITEIDIPESVSYIGSDAFIETPWLNSERNKNSLVIVNGILLDGKNARGKVEVPEEVVLIAEQAFSGNNEIESIVFSKNTVAIGDKAFFLCENLKFMMLSKKLQAIGQEAFAGCSSLKTIVDIDSGEMTDKLPECLVQIGEGAFSNCSEIESISLPSKVTAIGADMFSGCISLKKIEMPELTTAIGPRAFQSCIALKEVVIPEGVTVIQDWAFSRCADLKYIQFPQGLQAINKCAFSNCSSLEEMVFPDGIEYIYSEAFANCTSLKKIIFPESIKLLSQNVYSGCYRLEEIALPDSVVKNWGTTLEASWYNGNGEEYYENTNTNLKSFKIPEGVKVISRNAFANTALKSIEIPDSVEKIMDGAFYNSKIEKIEIPAGVTYIGSGGFRDVAAFGNCEQLREVIFLQGEGTLSLSEGIFKGCTEIEKVVLSEKIDYIGKEVFKGTKIKEIVIPGSVESVGSYAFADCTQLKKVVICEGVEYIGEKVFELIPGMEITFPSSVTSIGEYYREYSSILYKVVYYYSDCFEYTWEEYTEKVTLICPLDSYAYMRLINTYDPLSYYTDLGEWLREYIVWGGEGKQE